jgi:H+/gluconate symporter-like permease
VKHDRQVQPAGDILAALTGSASGELPIVLEALGGPFMRMAAEFPIDPSAMHRVAVIGADTLDRLPHNGAVVTRLAVCGLTHKGSYFDIMMVGIVGAVLGLVTVIVLGSMFGTF